MPADYEELRRAAEAATEGPWTVDAPGCVAKTYPQGGAVTVAVCGRHSAQPQAQADAHFIALCRRDVPALLSELAALRAGVGEAVEALDGADAECKAHLAAKVGYDAMVHSLVAFALSRLRALDGREASGG